MAAAGIVARSVSLTVDGELYLARYSYEIGVGTIWYDTRYATVMVKNGGRREI